MPEITPFLHMSANLANTTFIHDLQVNNGKVYFVGGIVRDHFMGRESKDIDLLVTGIPIDKLVSLLEPHGSVDVVGKSFGVIKFRPNETFKGGDLFDRTIDIAIPRTEQKIGKGHKGFAVVADHSLPIETDLVRRDFTMNAIAIAMDGTIIDPFNGLEDIKAKQLRMVSPLSFIEDPLRMLRAIQFAARFDLELELETYNAILKYHSKIKELSVERVTEELRKMIKGDAKAGIDLLIQTDLIITLTEFANTHVKALASFNHGVCGRISSLPQLLYLIFMAPYTNYSSMIAEGFKLSTAEKRELEALGKMTYQSHTAEDNYYWAWEAGRSWQGIHDTDFYQISIDNAEIDTLDLNNQYILRGIKAGVESTRLFRLGVLPRTLNELKVNAFELQQLGYEGVEIGKAFSKVVQCIMKRDIENDKVEILQLLGKYVKPENNDQDDE